MASKPRVRRPGTPWIDENGFIIYEVHKEVRKSFGLSFSSKQFDGWAEDGLMVRGYANFPQGSERIPFERPLTSGKELILHDNPSMMEALNRCNLRDKIIFDFIDGPPRAITQDPAIPEAVDEGSKRVRTHIGYERSRKLADSVRERAKGVCSLCEIDYLLRHGEHGASVIEAHHIFPIANGPRTSELDDFIALCASCHRLTHSWMRADPDIKLQLNDLKNRFRNG